MHPLHRVLIEGFNPSSLESYLESCRWFEYGSPSFLFQSFFSGKLFGKSPVLPSQKTSYPVSILLLWKVIWKVLVFFQRYARHFRFQSFFSGKLFGKVLLAI